MNSSLIRTTTLTVITALTTGPVFPAEISRVSLPPLVLSQSPFLTYALISRHLGFEHAKDFNPTPFNSLESQLNTFQPPRDRRGRFAFKSGGSPNDVLLNVFRMYKNQWISPIDYFKAIWPTPSVTLKTIRNDFRKNVDRGYMDRGSRPRSPLKPKTNYLLTYLGQMVAAHILRSGVFAGPVHEDWEVEFRYYLAAHGFGAAAYQLEISDLQALRTESDDNLGTILNLYKSALKLHELNVPTMTAFLHSWLTPVHRIPSDIYEELDALVEHLTESENSFSLANLTVLNKQFKTSVRRWLSQKHPDQQMGNRVLPELIDAPAFNTNEMLLLKIAAESVAQSFDEDEAASRAKFFYENTIPPTIVALASRIISQKKLRDRISPGAYSLSKARAEIRHLLLADAIKGWDFTVHTDPNSPIPNFVALMRTWRGNRLTRPQFAASAALEYAANFLRLEGRPTWTSEHAESHFAMDIGDLYATAIATLVGDAVQIAEGNPLDNSWAGVEAISPTISKWLFREGAMIALEQPEEWLRALNKYRFPRRHAMMCYGVLIAGMAVSLAAQRNPADPHGEAIHLLSLWRQNGQNASLAGFVQTAQFYMGGPERVVVSLSISQRIMALFFATQAAWTAWQSLTSHGPVVAQNKATLLPGLFDSSGFAWVLSAATLLTLWAMASMPRFQPSDLPDVPALQWSSEEAAVAHQLSSNAIEHYGHLLHFLELVSDVLIQQPHDAAAFIMKTRKYSILTDNWPVQWAGDLRGDRAVVDQTLTRIRDVDAILRYRIRRILYQAILDSRARHFNAIAVKMALDQEAANIRQSLVSLTATPAAPPAESKSHWVFDKLIRLYRVKGIWLVGAVGLTGATLTGYSGILAAVFGLSVIAPTLGFGEPASPRTHVLPTSA